MTRELSYFCFMNKKEEYAHRTIAEIVTEDISKAGVFKKYGLDFCCGGGRSIEEACSKKGIDMEALIRDLESVKSRTGDRPVRFHSWPMHLLVDYILEVHHNYVRENLPVLRQFAAKVAKVHAHADPELLRIQELVEEMAADLEMHMRKEEEILFPMIKKLSARQEIDAETLHMILHGPVPVMEAEHENVGDIIKEIRERSHQFTPPGHACNTYKALYFKLEEFEDDLFRHIHLENNILFEKLRQLTA